MNCIRMNHRSFQIGKKGVDTRKNWDFRPRISKGGNSVELEKNYLVNLDYYPVRSSC